MSKYFKVDVTKPPICPPNKTKVKKFFGGVWLETKESKDISKDYEQYLKEYREYVRRGI